MEDEQCANPDNESVRQAVKFLIDWAGDYPGACGWLGKFNYNGCEVQCEYNNSEHRIVITSKPIVDKDGMDADDIEVAVKDLGV